MTNPKLLDPAALDRLREWGGEKLVGQMIRLFLENSQSRMEQVRAGLTGDLAEAEKGAHSLKSSAANVGATQVRALAADLERLANAGDRPGVEGLVPQLEEAYAGACEALAAVEKDLSE